MKTYRVIYRIDTGKPGQFTDVELVVDHMPIVGGVVRVPDGSDRYGRVIVVERRKETNR
jgi:hypothetical protein